MSVTFHAAGFQDVLTMPAIGETKSFRVSGACGNCCDGAGAGTLPIFSQSIDVGIRLGKWDPHGSKNF